MLSSIISLVPLIFLVNETSAFQSSRTSTALHFTQHKTRGPMCPNIHTPFHKRMCSHGMASSNNNNNQNAGQQETLKWSDGSEIGSARSLASIVAALLSIPATAALVGQ
jgi:hypothetical protein